MSGTILNYGAILKNISNARTKCKPTQRAADLVVGRAKSGVQAKAFFRFVGWLYIYEMRFKISQ
jgi:hypothetical protein